jgi:hypothetical protein
MIPRSLSIGHLAHADPASALRSSPLVGMVTDKAHQDETVGVRAEPINQRIEARGSILRATEPSPVLTPKNATEAVKSHSRGSESMLPLTLREGFFKNGSCPLSTTGTLPAFFNHQGKGSSSCPPSVVFIFLPYHRSLEL